jgi:PTH1 family peptidyl-tRNA hydrolase
VRAIVGIGNPGSKYINNRHNVGIQFLDYFNKQKLSTFKASKFDYFFAEGELSGMPYVLIKPNTYVNLSGVAALNCLLNYNVDVKDFLVIVDDINFDIGAIRIRKSGGDGGHNGLKSIIYHLASNKFPRLKIGIGNDFKNGFLPDYVLSDFKKDEISKLNKSFDVIIQLIESFIVDGYNKMLNTYSRLINEKNVNNY